MNTWSFTYERYVPSAERLREALCTIGNGYFATRGAAPESKASGTHYPGTYLAGCFDRLVSTIDGRKLENECMVNVPNWLPLTFKLNDGEWFELDRAKILEYLQELDIRRGILARTVRFEESDGKITKLLQKRFAHMEDPHLAGLETTVVAENWSGRVTFLSALDGTVSNAGVERYRGYNGKHLLQVKESVISDDTIFLLAKTSQSDVRIAEAARTRVLRDGQEIRVSRDPVMKPGYVGQEFSISLEKGEPLSVQKIVALYTSRDLAISECGHASREKISIAPSFGSLLERHILGWDNIWRRFKIEVEGDEHTAQALRLHIFHLLQTVSPNSIDLDVGVPARGLHGEAYRGHIFWDELFVFPFLNLHIPDLTRSLLLYRYRRLPQARRAALEAGFRGAMYPWQSGSDGREESPLIHMNPLSKRWVNDNTYLQRHLGAAIAYNVWSYYQVTNDIDFLSFYGAEIMMEIARFFASIARYNGSRDRYEIHGVVGPDEYHDSCLGSEVPGINNNAYTNVMAAWVLCRALEVLELIPKIRREVLWQKLGLRREELELWEQISRKMFVEIHDGIISQFEGYRDLAEFDWSSYREKYGDIQRLDRILESEGDSPNNYKASKQADVLMLFYLLSAEELKEIFSRLGYPFEYETIPKNIEYYIERTCHGSSLSRIAHSWVLARGDREESWRLLREALESDISDIQSGTTAEGIHLGAMAGTVDIIQRCYTGIETRSDVLWLNPLLPRELGRLKLEILYRGHLIDIDITENELQVTSSPGRALPIKLGFRDSTSIMNPGESSKFTL